jgi:lactoylglutathione lyase
MTGYYAPEDSSAALELTYNWGTEKYDLGNAYGHIAIGVPDAAATCASIRAKGGKILYDAAPMMFDKNIVIAFIEDPDGYAIELIQQAPGGQN